MTTDANLAASHPRALAPLGQVPPACVDEAEYSITWTRRYPSAAGLHLLQLYMTLEASVRFGALATPVLAFACPDDPVCDFRATERILRRMPHAALEVVRDCEAKHVISGRHTCPSTIERVVQTSSAFLRRVLLEGGAGARRERH